MTRILTEGFESNNFGWLTYLPGSSQTKMVYQTTGVRSGTGARFLQAGGTSPNTSLVLIDLQALISNVNELYFRWAGYCAGDTSYIRLYDELGNIITRIDMRTAAVMDFKKPDNTIYTQSSEAIAGLTWHNFELRYKLDATDGVVQFKVDGVLVASYAGNTKFSAGSYLRKWEWYVPDRSSGRHFNVDDLCINDTSGAQDNSWVGDTGIIMLQPNADGSASQLMGSDGNKTSNYLLVDESNENGDTDYVYSSTPGEYDLYNLAALAALPVGTEIKRVVIEAQAREEVAENSGISLGTRSNTLTTWQVPQTLSISHKLFRNELTTNPATGAAWTETDVNNLEAGVKV